MARHATANPAHAAGRPNLIITGLSVSFGGVKAFNGVDLTVGAGELVGLIGPNGAGKSTFVDAVTGFVQAPRAVSQASPTGDRPAGRRHGWHTPA